MLKRILAIVGLIVIALWIIATVVVAFSSFPAKSVVFPLLMFGCILIPIMLWIILWAVSLLTGKKNIASFRSDEMDKVLKKAEEIKSAEELHSADKNDNE